MNKPYFANPLNDGDVAILRRYCKKTDESHGFIRHVEKAIRQLKELQVVDGYKANYENKPAELRRLQKTLIKQIDKLPVNLAWHIEQECQRLEPGAPSTIDLLRRALQKPYHRHREDSTSVWLKHQLTQLHDRYNLSLTQTKYVADIICRAASLREFDTDSLIKNALTGR